MSLTRQDLPALRQVVKEHLPLMPAESQVLHEIVTQVYLAEESYESDESLGFLGVVFDIEQRFEELPLGGVEIRHRIPGFCASRWLEDGDIILSVGDPPAALLHTDEDVRRAVQRHSARRRVEFEVLRRGRLLRVPIVLDAKPNDLQDGGTTTIADFMAPRQQSAQEYWQAQFQPLVEE